MGRSAMLGFWADVAEILVDRSVIAAARRSSA